MSETVPARPAEGTDDVAAVLAGIPLFEGLPEVELLEIARVVRKRPAREGEMLWRAGERADSLVIVIDGKVTLSLHLPGGRDVDIARRGPGEILGETPLLDGGPHPTTARVAERSTIVALSRVDFLALVLRNHPTAFTLKRRLAALACNRLRLQLRAIAAPLGGEAPHLSADAMFDPSGPPDHRYVRRLAAFRDFDTLGLWGFLTAGHFARVEAGATLLAEGEVSTDCLLTMKGAVERVIVRGGRRIRVGLAGPGAAFGYEGLIDGGPSPVTAVTRERTLLLVLPRDAFEGHFTGESAGSRAFLDAILRSLVQSMRQALRPQARLASSRTAGAEGPRSSPSRTAGAEGPRAPR
jgi:CRP-like cAMP-binding protein